MRIAIDARAFAWAGIGTYTRSLLIHCARLAPDDQFVALVRTEDLSAFTHLQREHGLHNVTPFVVEGKYYSWQEQTVLWWQLQRVDADLFHFTHFNMPLFFNRPYVVTIHDITRLIFPGQRRQSWWQQVAYEQVFRRAVTQARAVIGVSHTTMADLARLPLRLPPVRKVIYEGVAESFFKPVLRHDRQRVRMLVGTANPYLLYVGVWMGHKNLARLIEAYAQLREGRPGLRLVLAGSAKPGYGHVVETIRRLDVEHDVLCIGFVPTHLLPALYAEAACLVFPSLYEGFGLPPLEAAAVGKPVVASAVSSLPELLGSAVTYVNPEHIPSIVRGIERAFTESQRSVEAQAARQAVARQYRWETAAAEHLALYRQCV